jgi:hypothetical protein
MRRRAASKKPFIKHCADWHSIANPGTKLLRTILNKLAIVLLNTAQH